ncbi:MAG: A/G-specific adenine glycosylase [Ferruginibacter sp.]
MVLKSKHHHFTTILLHWHSIENTRNMPWKSEKDPYKIWLSEIILQQTQVSQGLGYYKNFVEKYPSIGQLAAAPEQEIFKLWEGLGYYSRCRNLIITAKNIAANYAGKFPSHYDELLKLKGIGPYTAAAIASFAFNKPHAVLDGNVSRVLSRFFCIHTAIDSSEGRKQLELLAEKLLDKKAPALYNQAIMDFGAVICKPRQPLCDQCLLQPYCCAFKKNLVNQLPFKSKKIKKTERWFYYFILQKEDKIMVFHRNKKDIWQNLNEFLLVEADGNINPLQILRRKKMQSLLGKGFVVTHSSKTYQQVLTHQTIYGYFVKLSVKQFPLIDHSISADKFQLEKIAFPRMIRHYLDDFPL